ncbi:MAG: serine protease [Pirellulales bacterium]
MPSHSSHKRATAVLLLLLLCIAFACGPIRAQCYVDPVTGQQICTPLAPNSTPTIDNSAHCRISVADGSTGSGTLIAVDGSVGLVLTCSHLFDTSAGRIVVTFPNGSRFAARLIDRDPAHDLAALAIRRAAVEPLVVSDEEPAGLLTACGFGPSGQFRGVRGHVVGQSTSVGALYPSVTMAGAVRPGDSGGGVLNTRGQLVGVVWGQRDGLTYATCGRPVREFLASLRGKQFVARPKSPVPSPQLDWQTWSSEMDSRLRALDEKKQNKGDYLQPGDLNGYVRIDDAPKIDPNQYARRSELDGKLKTLTARFESVQQHVEQIAASKGSFFQGLSLGKLIVGALGLSGPLAAAVVVAGGLAGRRLKRAPLRVADNVLGDTRSDRGAERVPTPIAVDTPPPPQRTVPETHYVPVEQDSFAKAHQWSSEHIARKYPGATEILQALDSLIKQYLAAKS